MTYFEKLQHAIAETRSASEAYLPVGPTKVYWDAWNECGDDLLYGISCGSEHAVQQQISYWLNDTSVEEDGDDAYIARMKKISEILLDTPIQSA